MKRQKLAVVCVVAVCCAAMALVDGGLHLAYPVKSAVKAALFLLGPLLYARWDGRWAWRGLFRMERRGCLSALLLGLGVFAVILGAYFLLRGIFDFTLITALLGENVGVTGENFLWVALYISFVNSLLEEFFFRGFAFLALSGPAGRGFAYGFSALAFALYHTAMMWGWFSPPLFLLALTGLTAGGLLFNWLNEKNGAIYASWMVHLFANLAINGVGLLLFGII